MKPIVDLWSFWVLQFLLGPEVTGFSGKGEKKLNIIPHNHPPKPVGEGPTYLFWCGSLLKSSRVSRSIPRVH